MPGAYAVCTCAEASIPRLPVRQRRSPFDRVDVSDRRQFHGGARAEQTTPCARYGCARAGRSRDAQPSTARSSRTGRSSSCRSSALARAHLIGQSEWVQDERDDLSGVHAAARAAANRCASLIAQAPDAAARLPHSEWTVRDLAAHLAVGAEIYVEYANGRTDPFVDVSDIAGGSLARTTAQRLAEEPEQDLDALASRFRAAVEQLLALTADRPRDELVMWRILARPRARTRASTFAYAAGHESPCASTMAVSQLTSRAGASIAT